MTTLTTTKPLRKIDDLSDSDLKTYEARCDRCDFTIWAQWVAEWQDIGKLEAYDISDKHDEEGWSLGSAATLKEANSIVAEIIANHKATCTAPPKQMPKVGDHGFARFYDWECPECETRWEGKWDDPYDEYGELTGGSEPYSLTQDGKEVGSYSYETAADMHTDFRQAVADHTCETQ